MIQWTKKYLPYIQEFQSNPVVGEAATELYNRAQQLFDGTITKKQFDDGIYIEVLDSDNDEIKLAKTSLNYMKDRIAECS